MTMTDGGQLALAIPRSAKLRAVKIPSSEVVFDAAISS